MYRPDSLCHCSSVMGKFSKVLLHPSEVTSWASSLLLSGQCMCKTVHQSHRHNEVDLFLHWGQFTDLMWPHPFSATLLKYIPLPILDPSLIVWVEVFLARLETLTPGFTSDRSLFYTQYQYTNTSFLEEELNSRQVYVHKVEQLNFF